MKKKSKGNFQFSHDCVPQIISPSSDPGSVGLAGKGGTQSDSMCMCVCVCVCVCVDRGGTERITCLAI